MLNKVVIASACRTPIGDLLGTLKDVHPRELGRIVGAEALKRAGLAPGQVDELVCGNVIQAGVAANICAPDSGSARHSLAGAGLHREPALRLVNARF